MSPTCNDCGNESKFKHYGDGWELRQYDPETGNFKTVINSDVESRRTECHECGSENVVFDKI